jgi:hypothetical protein
MELLRTFGIPAYRAVRGLDDEPMAHAEAQLSLVLPPDLDVRVLLSDGSKSARRF